MYDQQKLTPVEINLREKSSKARMVGMTAPDKFWQSLDNLSENTMMPRATVLRELARLGLGRFCEARGLNPVEMD